MMQSGYRKSVGNFNKAKKTVHTGYSDLARAFFTNCTSWMQSRTAVAIETMLVSFTRYVTFSRSALWASRNSL